MNVSEDKRWPGLNEKKQRSDEQIKERGVKKRTTQVRDKWTQQNKTDDKNTSVENKSTKLN